MAIGVWAAGFWLSVLDYQRFDEDLSSYLEVTELLPRDAVVLSLNFKDSSKTLHPYQHAWSWVCIERDCLSQELFADGYIQQIQFEEPLPGRKEVVPPYDLESIEKALESGHYQAILIVGQAPADLLTAIGSWRVESLQS